MVNGILVNYSTAGSRRTGVDGPSLFFRLQPISYLLLIRLHVTSVSLLRAHGTSRCMLGWGRGWNVSTCRNGVVSKSAMPPKNVVFTANVVCEWWNRSELIFPAWGRSYVEMKFQPGRSPAHRSSGPDSTVRPSTPRGNELKITQKLRKSQLLKQAWERSTDMSIFIHGSDIAFFSLRHKTSKI